MQLNPDYVEAMKGLLEKLPSHELKIDDYGGVNLFRDRSNYIAYLGVVRGQAFAAKKTGQSEQTFWTLDEALDWYTSDL